MAHRPRILVVDDDELLQELVKISLEGEGYVVVQAFDGAAMRRELEVALPDLIVLDVVLPDTDGRKLLTALKKDPRTIGIPVMLWSARYRDSESDMALDLGAEEFFEKGPGDTLTNKIE